MVWPDSQLFLSREQKKKQDEAKNNVGVNFFEVAKSDNDTQRRFSQIWQQAKYESN
jgi:hypothetical protein